MRRGLFVAAAATAASLLAAPVWAADSDAPLDSYRRARIVLERAILAHGGEPRLRSLRSVTVELHGQRHMIGQSPSPDGPAVVEPIRTWTWMDLEGDRYAQEQENDFPGGFHYRNRIVVTGETAFSIDLERNWDGAAPDRSLADDLTRTRATVRREMPAFFLLEALDRAATLRVAAASPGTRASITFADENGGLWTLSFDAAGRLARSVVVGDSWILGDQALVTDYGGWTLRDGIAVPTTLKQTRNGMPWLDANVTVTVDGPTPPDSLFTLPAEYLDRKLSPADAARVRRLAEGVYVVQGLAPGLPDGRTLFVDFADFVLVVEAPFGSTASEAVIREIEKTLPGKQIRYITFTHPHGDHGGGLRPYVARGVTIVTTPGCRRYVERLATATHTIRPDALTRFPRKPRIETFERIRLFDDGVHRVELHNLGRNDHADELVGAYLPREKMVYQGDMLILPTFGNEVPRGNALTRDLAAWIGRLPGPVESIVGTHGRIGTPDELRRAAVP